MRKPKNNIFSELYFDQYEVNVNPKNIRYFEVEENPLVKVICVLPVFRSLLSSLNFQVNLIEKKFIFTNQEPINLPVDIIIAGNCERTERFPNNQPSQERQHLFQE